jgi:hypothetical protein
MKEIFTAHVVAYRSCVLSDMFSEDFFPHLWEEEFLPYFPQWESIIHIIHSGNLYGMCEDCGKAA